MFCFYLVITHSFSCQTNNQINPKKIMKKYIFQHRRLSYSRHAVDDRDLSTQVNYKMHMNIRRMVADRKHHKRSKRLHKVCIQILYVSFFSTNLHVFFSDRSKDGSSKQNHVSFPEFQQNGSAKQLSNGTNHHQNSRKSKRKHSHSLNKYRRLELGN